MNASSFGKISGALFASTLWLCGCGQPVNNIGQSQLSLKVTGTTGAQVSPNTEIISAVVTIDEIRLIPSPDERLTAVVLLDDPITLDMAALPQATTDLVNGMPIPSGRYQEIRVVLDGAYIRVAGGGVYATTDYDEVPWGLPIVGELVTPSLEQSGVKVKLTPPLEMRPEAPTQTWLLQFDVAESFGHAAGDANWVMHPVIFATSVDASISTQEPANPPPRPYEP
jgi:hypothetical protein